MLTALLTEAKEERKKAAKAAGAIERQFTKMVQDSAKTPESMQVLLSQDKPELQIRFAPRSKTRITNKKAVGDFLLPNAIFTSKMRAAIADEIQNT